MVNVFFILVSIKKERRPPHTNTEWQTQFGVSFDLKHLCLSSEIPFLGPIVSLSVYLQLFKTFLLPIFIIWFNCKNLKMYENKKKRTTLASSGRRFLFLHFQQIPLCTSLFHYFCFFFYFLMETSFSSRQYILFPIFIYWYNVKMLLPLYIYVGLSQFLLSIFYFCIFATITNKNVIS